MTFDRTVSRRHVHKALLSVVGLAMVGCMHATPVTPAPLAQDRESELSTALIGKWRWVASQKPEGEKEDMPLGLVTDFTFLPGGAMILKARGMVNITREYQWSLEGANIKTTHPGPMTLRAESWTPEELKAFYYETSTMIWLRRQSNE